VLQQHSDVPGESGAAAEGEMPGYRCYFMSGEHIQAVQTFECADGGYTSMSCELPLRCYTCALLIVAQTLVLVTFGASAGTISGRAATAE